MICVDMLISQLCHRQCRANRISNLPSIKSIILKIFSGVVEKCPFLVVGDFEISDEQGPDLTALSGFKLLQADCNVDARNKRFINIAGAIGG